MRICALLICLLFPFSAIAQDAPRQIVVTGTGTVSAVPDMAVVNLGVTREAPAAAQAMREASEAARRVLDQISDAGIAPRDVQTSGINLSPVWDHSNDRRPQVRGYVASNDLTVRVRDLAVLGGVLDAVVSDGANTMNGLTLTVADPGPLEAEARSAAVRDARDRAETLATAAGLTLAEVVQISEVGSPGEPVPMMRGAMMEAAPVAAGEVDIRIDVTVTFGIAE